MKFKIHQKEREADRDRRINVELQGEPSDNKGLRYYETEVIRFKSKHLNRNVASLVQRQTQKWINHRGKG